MYSLIENIGVKNGFNSIHIWNQKDRIDHNLSELVAAGLLKETDTLILLSIRYSLNFQAQSKYPDIIDYVMNEVL